MGSQSAIGGGGRYDKLAGICRSRPHSGPWLCARFLNAWFSRLKPPVLWASTKRVDGYVACVDDSVPRPLSTLVCAARDAGLLEMDHQGKSLKSQFKTADKVNARVVDGARSRRAFPRRRIRNMRSHAEKLVDIAAAKRLLSQFGGQRVGGASSPINIDTVFSLENDDKE